MIKANNLVKNFGKTAALNDLSLQIENGKVLAIMGPSGSGKSTLLHCLAGIILPDSGEVYYEDTRITSLNDTERTLLRRSEFGFIFQFSQLVPELSALDNAAVPLLLSGMKLKDAQEKAQAALAAVDLAGKEYSLPGQLSGGEAQRVALARVLTYEPRVIFADEPTGSLDSYNSERVMELLVAQARNRHITVVLVTHEPLIAAYADNEVVVRDGKLVNA